MKKISVIIPCYNVSRWIDRCMQSLADQTIGMENLEIIPVDDASTDDTWQKILEWEKKYPESVMAVHCDINGRQGRARNIGLGYASADRIAFVDSDDWVEPDYLELLYRTATENDSDVTVCRLIRDPSETLRYGSPRPDAPLPVRSRAISTVDERRRFLFSADISFLAHSRIIRKSVLTENELLFPEGLAYEDCCWGSLLYYYVDRITYVDAELYHYFVNTDSTVLRKDADYHTDLLAVHAILWDEYHKRGLYPEYRDEIEYNYFYTFYLGFLKILANRYERPPYDQFLLMRRMVKDRIPDWRNNRYIRNGEIKEFHRALLELLDHEVDEKAFLEVLEAVKRSGI
ncbi:MAG: glycosyltransferase [Lachnospiraceae bacterium]|nr:glycosyltransferase [Lachnospiraceae bacterium]